MSDVAGAANVGPSPAELAEIDRIRNAFKSDGEGDREDPITYAREVVRLREELANFRTWGIIEIAVRNPSVSEYMEHWETRATTAEASLSAAQAEIERLQMMIELMLGAIDANGIDSQEIEGDPEGGVHPYKWHEEWAHNARSLIGGTDG